MDFLYQAVKSHSSGPILYYFPKPENILKGTGNYSHVRTFPILVCRHVSKNRGTPKSSVLIGFSLIFTIHFGVPLFLETPIFTIHYTKLYLLGRILWRDGRKLGGFQVVKLLYTCCGQLHWLCFVLWAFIVKVKTCTLSFLFPWKHFKSFLLSMSLLLFANPCRPSSFEIVEVMSHRLHPWVLKICLYRPKLRLKIFQKHHFKGRITSISIHAHPIQAIKHSKKFKLLGFFCNISSLFGSSKNVNFGCGGTMDIFFIKRHRGLSTRPGASRFSMRACRFYPK